MRIQSEAPENKAIPKFSTLKLITVPSLFDYLILFSTSFKAQIFSTLRRDFDDIMDLDIMELGIVGFGAS